jgi:hypothetical protein
MLALWTSDFTSSGWFQSIAWTLGAPIVIVSIVLGTITAGQRYSDFVANVPASLRPFNRPWFTEHPKRNERIGFALYILSVVLPRSIRNWVLPSCFVLIAVYLFAWTLWCILTVPAMDTPSKVYCAGLLALSGLTFSVALGLYALDRVP